MRLFIESIDAPLGRDQRHWDLNQDLERKIGEYYSVCPANSYKSYEDFIDANGERKRTLHKVFGYSAKGRLDDVALIEQLYNCLWGTVRRAWGRGAPVIWRRRPEIVEENDKDPGWLKSGKSGPDPDAPDNWIVKVTVRLGSPTPFNESVQFVPEGGLIPRI